MNKNVGRKDLTGKFAEKLLDRPDIIEDLIKIANEGKKYALETLKEHDYWCKDCKGNFIFIKPKHDAKYVADRLEKEKKILTHPYSNELLKDYIRVSTGSVNAMKIFIDAFLEIDGSN